MGVNKLDLLKKDVARQGQYRQVRCLIKSILARSKDALTLEEVHVRLQDTGYKGTQGSTNKTLYRMRFDGEVLVSSKQGTVYYFLM